MKLVITIPSPSPDLPEEVYNIDCPFINPTAAKRLLFKRDILELYISYCDNYSENIEAKYINK